MKKTKSTEQFLEQIENLNASVDKLKAFENEANNSDKTFDISKLNSFSWIENSPVCTKIVDLEFNLQYMSRAGTDKLKIEDITEFYGKPYPLSFYSDSFKKSMLQCLHDAKKTKESISLEASILDNVGNELWFQSTIIPVFDNLNILDHFMIVSLDITENKQAELSLKKSEEKLKEAFEITSLGTFVFDDRTDLFETSFISDNILGINKSYKRDIQGWMNLVHPEDLKNAQTLLDNANLQFVTSEFRIIRPNDKKIIWIVGHAKKEFNKNGDRTKITGTIQDITKRKETQEKLKVTKESLKSTFDLSPSIISSVNIETGYFINVNAAVTNILGYSVEEFISKPFIEFIHSDDVQKTANAVSEKLKGRNFASFENRYLCKDGSYKWIAWQGTEPNENGIVTAIGTDISNRKQVEKDLRRSAERFDRWKSSNFIGILQSNSSGKIVDANDTMLNMLGYSIEDLKKGVLDWTKLTPPEFSHLDIAAIKEAECKGFWTPFEKEYYHKDGHRIPILIGGSLFKQTQNEFIVFVINLTKSKKAENDLKISEEFLNLTGEITKVGGWEVDLITNKVKWSKETKNIHELSQDCQPDLEEAINFYHIDDQDLVRNHISNAVENNIQFSFEARIITAKEKLKYVKAIGQPVFENNKCIRIYGAFQDITDRKIIELKLENYRKQLETENVLLKKEISLSFNYEDMVYSSEEISNILTQVEQVSQTDATVLILGETGTGKELIAKAIHNTSSRKNNSLIRVNCAAIPSELIESELFGHVKGSFTGAVDNRIGKFELADDGTIFLDEIGELPLALQPKLLRAIQEGEIEPIGSSKLKKLNVRIIAATNKDLKKETKNKRFREDLYFRLNVFPITIPPLRNRIEDIPVLIDHFVNKYSKKHGKVIKYITEVTLQQMKSYAWPGNIRELENVIERAVIISNQDLLMIQEFDNSSGNNKAAIKNYSATLDEVQRNHIIKVLNKTQWKIDGNEGAALSLGLKPSTLRDRMKKLGIKRI